MNVRFCSLCGQIDDVESLKIAGINPRKVIMVYVSEGLEYRLVMSFTFCIVCKVAQLLVEVFAKMIFLHGYVHGDPHPGNILITPTYDRGKGQFQLGTYNWIHLNIISNQPSSCV
mgnify:CR=1 FL=1